MQGDEERRIRRVRPEEHCERYEPREGAIRRLKGCWYCRYADFHLKEEKALEIGRCEWPKRVI